MALAGNGRLAFLALSGLHDLAATLSGPATLLLVAELHERSFGEPPPSSIFAAGLTVQGVAAIAVSPVLCARLDGVGRRVGLICCALADAAVYFALFCVGFGSSTSYWPVLAAQALAGCNSGCKRASVELNRPLRCRRRRRTVPHALARRTFRRHRSSSACALLAAVARSSHRGSEATSTAYRRFTSAGAIAPRRRNRPAEARHQT